MTPADLQRFLDERGLTRKEFGRIVDVSQDRLRRMLAGEVPIRRHIALACSAIAVGLAEWPPVPKHDLAAQVATLGADSLLP